jgi:hypothetical protein
MLIEDVMAELEPCGPTLSFKLPNYDLRPEAASYNPTDNRIYGYGILIYIEELSHFFLP